MSALVSAWKGHQKDSHTHHTGIHVLTLTGVMECWYGGVEVLECWCGGVGVRQRLVAVEILSSSRSSCSCSLNSWCSCVQEATEVISFTDVVIYPL